MHVTGKAAQATNTARELTWVRFSRGRGGAGRAETDRSGITETFQTESIFVQQTFALMKQVMRSHCKTRSRSAV